MGFSPTKVCNKCGTEYPRTTEFFHKDGGNLDGLRGQCKVCVNARHAAHRNLPDVKADRSAKKRAYDAKHKEQRQAYRAEYNQRPEVRERNAEYDRRRKREKRDEINARRRQWRQEHPEEARARDKERRHGRVRWQRENPDKRRAYHVRWYEKRREEVLERRRRDRLENPEKYRSYVANRRALKAEAEGRHTGADVTEQRRRQRNKCFWCGEKLAADYHVDHVIPLSRGGSNGPENLVISCPLCNLRKAAKHPMEFAGVMF